MLKGLVMIGVLLAMSVRAQAGPFSALIDFGDSLSDVGNDYNSDFGLSPGGPGYYDGRFSNGQIWVEKLGVGLGLGAPTPSTAGGTDYAYGGVTSGTGYTTESILQFPNIETQVQSYTSAHTAPSTALFTVLGGANDLLNYLASPGSQNPVVVADTAADNIAASVKLLYADGARNILVANLPNLGLTPRFVGTSGESAAAGLSVQFDTELAGDLAALSSTSTGLNLYNLNLYGLFGQVIASPASYGLTDVTDQAYTGDNDFIGDGTINPNASTYLFWDSIHPTTTGHALIAGAALAAVVPEPASVALVALGTIGLLGTRRKRS